ncbi:alpha/beta fold hydrolase [Actinoplanes sp. NPDC051851]|uniref:alpha/beta fold hydrolase n=1 Tax=Actinoplanes sp. NPDC051851 TaxID=3154753 RepID=UPI00343223BA
MTVTLAHRTAGDPAHPPLVLLHGLGDDGAEWEPLLPELARAHHVHALDLRGHGDSPHPGDYSFELMRDDVLAHLDTAGIATCVLLGHSMGAVVATLVAQAAPHRVTRLVLEDAVAPRPGALHRPPIATPDEPTPFDFAAVHAIRAQLDAPDPAWWDRTPALATPTLIIGGDQSPIPRDLLTDAAALMPEARFTLIPAGHYPHRDAPAAFLSEVTAFLS